MQSLWMPSLFVNTFAAIILLVILVDVTHKQNRFMLDDQLLFVLLVVVNLVLLISDTATFMLNGQTFQGARGLNLLSTMVYYACTPIMSLLYLCFCDVKLGVPLEKRKHYALLYSLPGMINLLLTVLSVQGHYLFRLSEDNLYSRGSLLTLSFLLCSVLMAVAFFRVALYALRAKQDSSQTCTRRCRRNIYTLLGVAIPPLLGAISQIWFYQITVVWVSTVIGILIIFINMQNVEISTDSLTGLFNRRQADSYLQNLLQAPDREQPLILVILDINNFKQINDRYGHIAGDNGLRMVANALQTECNKEEFFSRYGGDEFIVIARHSQEAHILDLVSRINNRLTQYCKDLAQPYLLSISAGFAQWSPQLATQDDLFAFADAKLFEQKKRLQRRASDAR